MRVKVSGWGGGEGLVGCVAGLGEDRLGVIEMLDVTFMAPHTHRDTFGALALRLEESHV